jgi:hypothetical protein
MFLFRWKLLFIALGRVKNAVKQADLMSFEVR